MNNNAVTEKAVSDFERFLKNEEREKATIEKYIREVRAFGRWLCGRTLEKEAVIEWKEHLQKERCLPCLHNQAGNIPGYNARLPALCVPLLCHLYFLQ